MGCFVVRSYNVFFSVILFLWDHYSPHSGPRCGAEICNWTILFSSLNTKMRSSPACSRKKAGASDPTGFLQTHDRPAFLQGSAVPRLNFQHHVPQPAAVQWQVLQLRCYVSHDSRFQFSFLFIQPAVPFSLDHCCQWCFPSLLLAQQIFLIHLLIMSSFYWNLLRILFLFASSLLTTI